MVRILERGTRFETSQYGLRQKYAIDLPLDLCRIEGVLLVEAPTWLRAGVRVESSHVMKVGAYVCSESCLSEALGSVGRYVSIASGVEFVVDASFLAQSLKNRLSSFGICGGGFPSFAPDRVTSGNALPAGGTPKITVGNDVIIGSGARIFPGARIDDGVIVLPDTLVDRDVPAYSIVSGRPYSIVGTRFDPELVRQLQQIRWWDHSWSAGDFDVEDACGAVEWFRKALNRGSLLRFDPPKIEICGEPER